MHCVVMVQSYVQRLAHLSAQWTTRKFPDYLDSAPQGQASSSVGQPPSLPFPIIDHNDDKDIARVAMSQAGEPNVVLDALNIGLNYLADALATHALCAPNDGMTNRGCRPVRR